ncbi:TetR/AcrR family transcriptional regulator [Azotosporobacter soli]|uniref:TetR/AcrR family transcriptional regulator n=1 Tax=Azotosporobacter soli TaxID=3055040 RepID=UPI0031FEB02D
MEQDTRIRLLDAATPLFAQKGLGGVSIRQLADAAAVNSALISYYFSGKEGLYTAVLENQFSSVSESLPSLSDLPADMTARLSCYAELILAAHRRHPYLLRLWHNELANPTPCFESVVKKHIQRFYNFLHACISSGSTSGEFKSDIDPAYAALSLVGILNFYFIAKPFATAFFPERQDHDVRYIEQALHIYLNGIRR